MVWRRPRARTVLFALGGAVVGVALGGQVGVEVGPFDCTALARPSLEGTTTLRLAPLGSIDLDTHSAPVDIVLRVDELRPEEARRFAADPELLEGLEDDLAADAERALRSLALATMLAATAGGIAGALAARVDWRGALLGGGVGVAFAGSLAGLVTLTFRPEAVAEPQYSGLLTVAPRAVGDVESILERFADYRAQLTGLVANVVTLYEAAEGLETFRPADDSMRVLHVSDIHLNPQAFDLAEQLVDQFDVDLVIDTGDLTDWGTDPESRLVERIGDLGVPYVWVRGNHDSTSTQAAVARQPNAVVLDGRAEIFDGLRIWGIGDPRYTPEEAGDEDARGSEIERIEAYATTVEERVEFAGPGTIDVVAIHDERAAALIGDDVPLVLAGHRHEPAEDRLEGGALLLREGSTGGAGLRGLQGEEPEPLTASVLYFDRRTDRLVAYDRVTVDGFGGTGARIARHVVEADEDDGGADEG